MHDKLEIVNTPADKMTRSVDDRCSLGHTQQQAAGDTDMQLLSCGEELRYPTSNLEMSSSNGGRPICAFARDHAGKDAHEKNGPSFLRGPISGSPTWTRTKTKGSKDPCAAITPWGNGVIKHEASRQVTIMPYAVNTACRKCRVG